jgi:hypothetical protein
LFSVSREGKYEVPQIISSTSQQHVVDVLFSYLIKRDRKAREMLARSRQAVDNL